MLATFPVCDRSNQAGPQMQSLLNLSRTTSRTGLLLAQVAAKPAIRQFSTSKPFNMIFPGGCYCKKVRYEIDLEDADKARTSICHCKNCKVSEICYDLGRRMTHYCAPELCSGVRCTPSLLGALTYAPYMVYLWKTNADTMYRNSPEAISA